MQKQQRPFGISTLESKLELRGQIFDGRSSKRTDTIVHLNGSSLYVNFNEEVLTVNCDDAVFPSRVAGSPGTIGLPDGVHFVADDAKEYDKLAAALGKVHLVTKLETRWRYASVAFVILSLFVCFTYFVIIPAAAKPIAKIAPSHIKAKVSDNALASMEKFGMLKANDLDPAHHKLATDAFSELQSQIPEMKTMSMELRSAGFPNAFALPDGRIIVTDKLVKLSGDKNEIKAVLLHEAGHVIHQHGLQTVVQSATLSVLLFTMFGTVDLSNLPLILLQSRYSRAFETEADLYAKDNLHELGIPPKTLGTLLRKLQGEAADGASDSLSWFSSHPRTEDREKILE